MPISNERANTIEHNAAQRDRAAEKARIVKEAARPAIAALATLGLAALNAPAVALVGAVGTTAYLGHIGLRNIRERRNDLGPL
jgi:hypothetical protein